MLANIDDVICIENRFWNASRYGNGRFSRATLVFETERRGNGKKRRGKQRKWKAKERSWGTDFEVGVDVLGDDVLGLGLVLEVDDVHVQLALVPLQQRPQFGHVLAALFNGLQKNAEQKQNKIKTTIITSFDKIPQLGTDYPKITPWGLNYELEISVRHLGVDYPKITPWG